jgi:hypothetical protein
MKEIPILFTGAMVRALLEGRKTQTRRIVKNATGAFFDHAAYEPVEIRHREWAFRDKSAKSLLTAAEGSPVFRCPYGTRGDQLWVKETFSHVDDFHGKPLTSYRATDANPLPHWKPSIFMPRLLSRILLEIVEVRVERLQDITEKDAIAEGIEREGAQLWKNYTLLRQGFYHPRGGQYLSAVNSYRTLWESINGPGSWERNPWVWALTFRRIIP